MLETQSFASATALMRGQILPPSEMKSLYGSTTSSAVMPLSYVGVFTAPLLRWLDCRDLLTVNSSVRPVRYWLQAEASRLRSWQLCRLSLRSATGHFCPAASRIRFAIVSGCDISET